MNSTTGVVLFTDLVDFTAFTSAMGDEVALQILTDSEKIIIDGLASGSRLVKTLGDGTMLWFPEAASAISTALELQHRFLDENLRGHMPLWVRIGGHYGTQTVHGNDLVGHSVNLAARVTDQAGPGEVIVSEATVEATANSLVDEVDFLEIGPTTMKGIPDPIWLYRAVQL